MPFKPHSQNSSRNNSADLFCQARLIELSSIAQRASDSVEKVPAAAEKEPIAGRSLIPSQQSVCSASIFHMAVHSSGWWEIREGNGSKAGLFRTRQAAIKFARDESPGGRFVIVDDTLWG
ncbi:protein of unknown function [Hyphomicrobium sp. MC1]|nr:protein of unknown function [Hyphomicrobium sp. MC1]